MNEFHQHPDGFIYVRTDAGTYADTVVNFLADAGLSALPPLPAGADDHIYRQGKRHAYMGDGTVIAGGPMPWPEGDTIIARYSQLKLAQMNRQPPPPPPPPPASDLTPEQRLNAIGLTVAELKQMLGIADGH